jgi:hypothetical protein
MTEENRASAVREDVLTTEMKLKDEAIWEN